MLKPKTPLAIYRNECLALVEKMGTRCDTLRQEQIAVFAHMTRHCFQHSLPASDCIERLLFSGELIEA